MKALEQDTPRKLLNLLAAIVFVAGLGFWLWNPGPPTGARQDRKPGSPPTATVTAGREGQVNIPGIVAANIFSPKRAAPSRRYDPANPDGPDVSMGAPDMAMESPPQVALPQLFGTVLGPAGAMALMQGDSSDGPGRLFREGDRIGRFRIVKVKTNSVIVSGPSGRVEIPVERNRTGAQ